MSRILARRIDRFLKRQGLLERDVESSHLAGDDVEAAPIDQVPGASIPYRIAFGPRRGRKVFTLQTLPPSEEPFDEEAGKMSGFCRVHRHERIETGSG